jgi:hypothetical protein
MKNLLKELGFEHLPMMTEFVSKLEEKEPHYRYTAEYPQTYNDADSFGSILGYMEFITQPLKEGMFELIDMPHMTLHQSCILADDKSTIEQIINSGIELKLKP